MIRYAVRKLLHTAFVALGGVTLVFATLRLSGDPAATMLPGDASVDELAAFRHALGLDRALRIQYWIGSQPGQRFHDLMEQARTWLDQKKRTQLYTEATGGYETRRSFIAPGRP